MIAMNNMFEIIASLSESFIVVRLCNRSFEFKNRQMAWLKTAVFFIILSADNIFLSQHSGYETVSLILLLLATFGYVMIFLNGKIYEKILISMVPHITILPINLIALNVLRALTGVFTTEVIEPGGRLRVPLLIFTKLAFFFVCEFLIHIWKRNRYSLSSFQWILQLSCFVTTFLIGYLLWSIPVKNDDIPLYFLASIMIVILNVLLYIVMDKMQYDSVMEKKYEISRMNLAAQERFVDEARERYMEIRTLRHDIRHYLMATAELISIGRTAEAKDYIEKIIDEKINRAAGGIDTGSVVIDAVINNKIAACVKNNIEVKCMIDSRLNDVNEMDISILLSNVLENAISGCKGADSPEIELIMGTRKTFTYIIVKNSIAESVLIGNPNLETQKEDKSVHGFGIMSIRKVAEKYRGTVEFREENNTFIAEIWLEG